MKIFYFFIKKEDEKNRRKEHPESEGGGYIKRILGKVSLTKPIVSAVIFLSTVLL